jgi:glycosyltransferase involved in cell wall biosynthesis
MKAQVSVLIPVKNEEAEIVDCVRSVRWADEVVVVDSSSADRTRELAEAEGASVIQFHFHPGGPKKKNWALDNVAFRNEWVLILDADERITEELAVEIQQTLNRPGKNVGFFINRQFFFMDRWIKHAGYYPSWNLRLFKRTAGRYERVELPDTQSGDNEVHEHVVLNGPAGNLRAPMRHFAYRSVEKFVTKHNRYSNWESQMGNLATQSMSGDTAIQRGLNRRRSLKRLGRLLPCPHWARFFYHFVLRLGFLDGLAGYILCHLISEYEFLIWAKRVERSSSVRSASFKALKLPHPLN